MNNESMPIHRCTHGGLAFGRTADCAFCGATPQAEPAVAEQARRERVQSLVYTHRLDTASAFDVATRLIENAAAFIAALASQSTPPPESAGLTKVRNILERMNRKGGLGLDVHEWVGDALDELDGLAANPTAQPDGGSKA